jgi:hypothetical protein
MTGARKLVSTVAVPALKRDIGKAARQVAGLSLQD